MKLLMQIENQVVSARINESDLELTAEQFFERYAKPAFEQLKYALKYQLDHQESV